MTSRDVLKYYRLIKEYQRENNSFEHHTIELRGVDGVGIGGKNHSNE